MLYNKAGHEFFDIVPKKRSIQDKNAEEWNNLHATYFPKGAPFSNNTQLAPLPSHRAVSCEYLCIF